MSQSRTGLMSIDQAADALSNLAYSFHNDMLRQGIKELSPEEWLKEFRSWLPSGRDFAHEHERLIGWLEEVERREEAERSKAG